MCQETIHRNRLIRAILLTKHTADTAGVTGFHDHRTFFMAVAGYYITCIIRNQFNEFFRAGFNTLSAGFASFFVHYCHAIYYMNCIKRTDRNAGAKTHAAGVAALRTAARRKRSHPAVPGEGGNAGKV